MGLLGRGFSLRLRVVEIALDHLEFHVTDGVLGHDGGGAETHVAAQDVRGWVEAVAGHVALLETAGADGGVEDAEAGHHDILAGDERLLDELVHGGEDSHDVGLREGGLKDNLVANGLDVIDLVDRGTQAGVVDAFLAGRIAAGGNFYFERHDVEVFGMRSIRLQWFNGVLRTRLQ